MAPPPVPVTTSVYVPRAVVEVVAMVSVADAEPFAGGVTELGLTPQVVTFAGHPETVRLTEELNPASEATVTCELPELPCATVNDDGLADMLKSGAAGTMSNDPIKVFHEPPDELE